MPIALTQRVAAIRVSPTSAAAERAREMKAMGMPVISLTTGEPDFATPCHILDAADRAMRTGATRYTSVGGTPDIKAAIREKFESENGLAFSDQEILVSNGAKQVIFNAIQALVEPGCEVIIPTPAWVSYGDMVQLAGGEAVMLDTEAANGFRLTPESLAEAIGEKTRILLLNSPCNPTGVTFSRAELEAFAEVLLQHPQVFVITDDIYEHIRYSSERFSTLAEVCSELASRVLTVNGVSKAFSMTGWRIGFAGGPAALVSAMTKIQSQSTGNPASVSQAAALAALRGSRACVEEQCQAFAKRRQRLLGRLARIPGFEVLPPEGAFYFFVSFAGLLGRATPNGSMLSSEADFVAYLLEEGNVAVVGGAAFGRSPYFRMSFAASDAQLDEAVDRIERLVLALR